MEEVIDKIIELLQAGLGTKIKKFYFGDPIEIPLSNMPCIAVEPDTTNILVGPTGMDDQGYNLIIKIIDDKRKEFGKQPGEVTLTRTLVNLAEGLDTTQNELETQTVAGILRKNFRLDQNVYDQKLTIQYGVTPRPEAVLTAEAHIRVNLRDLVQVRNRV